MTNFLKSPAVFISAVKKNLEDPLQTFKFFERIIAAFCISIPLILWLADTKDFPKFLDSISAYVRMTDSYIFGMLLCMAAMLFIFNGAVYYKNEPYMHISRHGQWYNVVLGVSLMGVILFPYDGSAWLFHYFFAIVFFLGNAVVTGIFYKDKDKKKSIALAVLTVISMPLHFMGIISLFVAEWISLSVIGIHFILSTVKLDEQVTVKKPKELLLRHPAGMPLSALPAIEIKQ
jgi:hypothetical protein